MSTYPMATYPIDSAPNPADKPCSVSSPPKPDLGVYGLEARESEQLAVGSQQEALKPATDYYPKAPKVEAFFYENTKNPGAAVALPDLAGLHAFVAQQLGKSRPAPLWERFEGIGIDRSPRHGHRVIMQFGVAGPLPLQVGEWLVCLPTDACVLKPAAFEALFGEKPSKP